MGSTGSNTVLCVIPFFAGDKHLAENLARWIAEQGGVSKHDCLLIVDKSTTSAGVIEPLRGAFASVTETSAEPVGDQGSWGKGTTNAEAPNEMWLTALAYVYHVSKRPWFWLETDAVPMRATWLDEIETEYQRGKKPFMGAYVDIAPHEPHMSGIGVYPADVAHHSMDMAVPVKMAWDYAGRKDTVGKGKAHFTNLIQHEYRIHGESPTFPTQASLSVIRPETAVFHRCKDFSLIDRLREKMGKDSTKAGKSMAASVRVESPASPSLLAENVALKKQVEELTAELNALRIAPAVEACKPKKQGKPGKPKRPMSEAHKAALKASWAKRKMTGVV